MITKIGFSSYIDAKGILTFSPNNLVLNSNDFSQSSWGKENCQISMSNSPSPVFGEQSWQLIENGGDSAHYIYGKSYNIINSHIIISLFAKAMERDSIVLEISNFKTGSAGCRFNLSTGAAESAVSTTDDYSELAASIVKYPGGWFRCSLRVMKGHQTNENFLTISLDRGGSNIYPGDGQSGVLISCAQMEAVSYQNLPNEYLNSKIAPALGVRYNHDPISRKLLGIVLENSAENLVSYGESFARAEFGYPGWVYDGIERSSTNKLSPSGELLASNFIANKANATLIYAQACITSEKRTFSCWLRSPNGRALIKYTSDGGNSWDELEITEFWKRYILKLMPKDHQMGFCIPKVAQEIEIWGGQLETGNCATSYIPVERGVSTRATDGLLIIDSELKALELKIFDLATQQPETVTCTIGRDIDRKNIIINGWREVRS